MQKIAIFGGTFNPIHWGHLLIAETALEQAALDRVIWVPTYRPPHKNWSHSMFSHRLEMVRLAIADYSAFSVSDVDARHQGVSYAIATLSDLQGFYPSTHWFWLLGFDAFQTLPQWRESQNLAAQCSWLVAPRRSAKAEKIDVDGEAQRNEEAKPFGSQLSTVNSRLLAVDSSFHLCEQVAAQMGNALRWQLLQMPQVEISSSLVRHYCREGRSIRYLVPDSVRIYIEAHKLYIK